MRIAPGESRIPTVQRGAPFPRTPRWPSLSYERGEGLLLTAPSLSGQAVYLSVGITRWSLYSPRGRSYLWHIGWGRQFVDEQPRWAHYIWRETRVPWG